MRTSLITINHKIYCLALSNRVLVDIENRGTSLEEFLQESGKTVSNICWLLQRMSEAGRAYMAMNGMTNYTAITEDEILDASGSDDYDEYMNAIIDAAGGERKVDAEAPKNAEATHAEAPTG